MAGEKREEGRKTEHRESKGVKGTGKDRRKAAFPRGVKQVQAIIALAFLCLLAVICAAGLLHRDETFSDWENRMLAQKPKLSFANLASGQFMRQYEQYQADQFPGRSFWLQMKTLADSISGKTEENGVFNGSDSYLLEDITVPDDEVLNDNLEAMKRFAGQYKDVDMHMMLVPNSAYIYKSKLPFLAVTADQGELIEEVRSGLGEEIDWIDVTKTMKEHRDEEIYYHTDKHWTTLGAWYAFQDAEEQLQLADKEQVEMKAYGVSNRFNGTLSAISGYQTGYKEAIYIYLPQGDTVPQYVVNYVEEEKVSASLYDSSKLEEREQYGVFLGGNHALVDIKTTLEQGERLLVIKDSYANCFIPFLVPYYREILVIDPQYYSGELDELMEENEIDRVLFLYNANTFLEDRMLSGVLGNAKTENAESRSVESQNVESQNVMRRM